MSIKIAGKKNVSYYNFLRGIGEEGLPIFTEEQVQFANYLSAMLPLVRKHEYVIFGQLLKGVTDLSKIRECLESEIENCNKAEIFHALHYMVEAGYVSVEPGTVSLKVKLDEEFTEYLQDLISYGLTRYVVDFGDTTDFKLWQNYRMDQVQMKFLKNPQHNQLGTYYYDNKVIIFASLKKDASIEERLNYKDKFIEPALFQWESVVDVSPEDVRKQINSECAYLFIRKVSMENGIVLPFTYVGKGKMTNPRRQEKFDSTKGRKTVTYLYDIVMENALPDYLQYDFGLIK